MFFRTQAKYLENVTVDKKKVKSGKKNEVIFKK